MKRTFLITALMLLTICALCEKTQAQWISVNGPWVQPDFSYVNSILTTTDNLGEPYLFAATFFGGVYRTPENETAWTPVNTGITHLTVKAIEESPDGQFLFAGTNNGGAFRSSDFGQTWIAINNGLPNLRLESFAFNDNYVFTGTHEGIYRSSNNGDLWTFSGPQTLVYSFAVKPDGTGGNYIFSANSGGVHRSSDNGVSWIPVNNGINDLFMLDLAVKGQDLFAGGSGGVYRSSDNGNSWVQINSGFNASHNVWFVEVAGEDVYAGVSSLDGGVFKSTNNGDTWTEFNNGLSGFNYFVICAAQTNRHLYIGTGGDGVFKHDIALSIENNNSVIADEYRLEQNFPNPFNPVTTINFSVPKDETVSLTVFDALGREVKQLVNGFKQTGSYSVKFSGDRLTSGVYYYALKTGDGYSKTMKMILIK